MTKGGRDGVYSLENDNSILIKETDKGSAIVVWDRDDYLREAKNQLNDKIVYKDLTGNVEVLLKKSSKLSSKKSEIGEILATTH